MEQELDLFADGCLGTCWYGKYHYLEPWVGCEHNCSYCYARFRSDVTNRLKEANTTFDHPVPLKDANELPGYLYDRIQNSNVNIIKLSRYTDFFTPSFVKNGFVHEVLEALCKSKAERLIITTKGVPDADLAALMGRYSKKISYNAAIKPENPIVLEPGVSSVAQRVETAARIAGLGIQTTIHMDPMVAGIDDSPEALTGFFSNLQKLGLNRVMFSYLLLSEELISHMEKTLAPEDLNRILNQYDIQRIDRILPKQDETTYSSIHPEIRKASIDRISSLLKGMDFDFVLCGLKSGRGGVKVDHKACPICDGSFYA